MTMNMESYKIWANSFPYITIGCLVVVLSIGLFMLYRLIKDVDVALSEGGGK